MSQLETLGSENGFYFTADALMRAEFPEPRWAVHGLIPEGVSLLVGSPKFGKSWMCLGLAIAVAHGGKALGKIDVEQGSVLYAALEDTPRRLQDRLGTLLRGSEPPAKLHITTELPRIPVAIDILAGWLDEHPDARLVMLDVFRKVKPIGDGRSTAYDSDYDAIGPLKQLAEKYGVAIVLVHHSRKMADDSDVFNEVSGSTGLTGAVDATLIAKRARDTSEATLHITGRDVTEGSHALSWHSDTCQWTLLDEPVSHVTLSATRRRISEYLEQHPGHKPAQIADGTGLGRDNVRQIVRKMTDALEIDTDGEGRYYTHSQRSQHSLPEPEAVNSVNGVNGLLGGGHI